MAKDVADLIEFLPRIALFGGLETATLKRVIALMKGHAFNLGDEVCCQGDSGREMFVVRRGEVVVCRDSEAGHRVKMVRMGEGEFFGDA